MNALVIVATVLLLIQGFQIVTRPGSPPFVRSFGVLTLLLAGVSFALFAILFWGEAVLSPEFDVVMARGHWRGLVVLLIGFGVAAGLGLHVQRLKADLPGRLGGGLVFVGLVVGILAATRISPLPAAPVDAETDSVFWIYSYDLWWPPLLIWLSGCLLDGAITILGVRDRRLRAGAILVMLLTLSWYARRRQVFADPTSASLWYLAWVLAALGGLLFVLWLVWSAGVRPVHAWRGLAAAARRALPAMRWQWQGAMSRGWPYVWDQLWGRLRPMIGQLLAVTALAVIAVSLASIFYLGWLPHGVALGILAVAWICLAEFTAQGPVRAFIVDVVPEVYGRLAHQGSWVSQVWLLLRAQLAGPLSRLGTALRRLVSLRPFPEALMKIAVLLLALVVAYEVPHKDKTLLQPFTALAFSTSTKEGAVGVPTVSAQAEIGRAVFDHLFHTLGVLTVELQPDVILLLPPDPEQGARFRTLAAGGPGSIDLFLSQGTDIDVGFVKLPLGFLLTPVLQPVRWLLGVRVVNGSVLADPEGYTILVRSSSGERWRARLTDEDVTRELEARDGPATARSAPDHAFNRLALELAFRIMSSEPTLAASGMTQSWDAFEEFRGGLGSWREFTLHGGLGDPGALTAAIDRFRAAVAIDPGFALAHYRLGVALHNDGQPLAASEALRASLKVNPGFVPAMVALASVLFSPEPDLGVAWFGVRKATQDEKETTRIAKETTRIQAARLWRAVIGAESASSLNRAAAWAGLCRHALDEAERRGARSDGVGNGEPDSVSYRIAYFYCQQAERLYAGLVAVPRDDLRVRTARASELASIGMLLERHGPRHGSLPGLKEWQCSRATIDDDALAKRGIVTHNLPVTHYAPWALRYYRRAVDLLPNDPVLRCHEASAAFAVSTDEGLGLMRALETDASSRFNLAESYRREARGHLSSAMTPEKKEATDRREVLDRSRRLAARYFEHALSEYAATLERDPTNFDALTRYAQVFWEWRHGVANGKLPVDLGPRLEHARRAESNARKAIAMIDAKRIRPPSREGDTRPGGPAARPESVTPVGQASPAVPAADPSRAATSAGSRADSLPKRLWLAAATARASLGAVLVAQTRAHEAIDELKGAPAPDHPSFDHVRWMLAQAHLCAASREFRAIMADPRVDGDDRDDRMDALGAHREKARPLLDVVRKHERSRESPTFPVRTDISRSDPICRRDMNWLTTVTSTEGRKLRYKLLQAESDNYRKLCDWVGVRMYRPKRGSGSASEPRYLSEKDPIYLHVWGGDVDDRVWLNPPQDDQEVGRRRPDPIRIIEPKGTPFYYFAQLENEEGLPVSSPVVLEKTRPLRPSDAPASGSASTCPGENLIQLTAEPMDSTTPRVVADN